MLQAFCFLVPNSNTQLSSALGKISKTFFLFQVKRMNFQIQMEWSIALYNNKTNSLLVLLHGRKAICSITALCCKIVVVSSAERDEMQIGDGCVMSFLANSFNEQTDSSAPSS